MRMFTTITTILIIFTFSTTLPTTHSRGIARLLDDLLKDVSDTNSNHVPDDAHRDNPESPSESLSDSGLAIDEVLELALLDKPAPTSGRSKDDTWRELDMWLTREQEETLHGSVGQRTKRKAHYDLSLRWTNNTLVYRRTPDAFTEREWQRIEQAMKHVSDATCISFLEDVNFEHRNYAYFDTGDGCTSYVGMIGGAQKIKLGPGCVNTGTIVHELGHAIGFFHEHARPDRDDYIEVLYENVSPSRRRWFTKHPAWKVNYYNVPYDYKSVMHYSRLAFSEIGGDTIRTKDPSYMYEIGFRSGLSFYDIMLANRMYKCDAHCDQTISCPDDSYRGKDCKCYCNLLYYNGLPIQVCDDQTQSGISTTATKKPGPSCEDHNGACASWANSPIGLCTSHAAVRKSCPKSCNICDSLRSTEATTRTTSTTRLSTHTVTSTTTPTLSTTRPPTRSASTTITSTTRPTTRSTTTQPTIRTTTRRPTITTAKPCTDDHGACYYWASVPGLCDININVRNVCKRSCNSCSG